MNIRYFRHAVIAAAALAGLPAFADTINPGTLCTSDGSVGKSLTGLMLNKVVEPDGYKYFHCPIVRVNLVSSVVTVTVTAKTNTSPTGFTCTMRSVYGNNVTLSEDQVSFPNNVPYDTQTLSVSVLAIPTVVNMRCRVPNAPSSGNEAGIVSYVVNE